MNRLMRSTGFSLGFLKPDGQAARKSPKGLSRFVISFRNSVNGFRDIWRGEEAFRTEIVVLAISVPLAVWIAKDALVAAILIAAVLLVLIVEVLNSAIEALVDRIGPERHELSRMAKDLGSLAVLLSIIAGVLVWGGAIFSRLPQGAPNGI